MEAMDAPKFGKEKGNSVINYGMFKDIMQKFFNETSKIYDNLDGRFKIVEKEFEKVTELYGEDPKNTAPEDFFGIFSAFCNAFSNAKTENEVARVKELADKKRDDTKKQEEETRRKKTEVQAPIMNKDGGLDDLISSMKTGKAFLPEGANVRRNRKGGTLRKDESSKEKTFIPSTQQKDKLMFQNQQHTSITKLKHNLPKQDLKALLKKDAKDRVSVTRQEEKNSLTKKTSVSSNTKTSVSSNTSIPKTSNLSFAENVSIFGAQ